MLTDREDIKLHMGTITEFANQSLSIVEIGPDMGNGSTRAIGHSMVDCDASVVWVTVDIDDHIDPDCRPDYPNWHMVVGDSRDQNTADRVAHFMGLADLIFIDTIHDYDFLKRELQVWEGLAHLNTVWLFHDTWMQGKYNHMTDAIKEFAAAHESWRYEDLSTECNGLGALIPVGWKEGHDYELCY